MVPQKTCALLVKSYRLRGCESMTRLGWQQYPEAELHKIRTHTPTTRLSRGGKERVTSGDTKEDHAELREQLSCISSLSADPWSFLALKFNMISIYF